MKIVFINTPIFDYMTAGLIEGLTALGHDVACSEASNYGRALPDVDLRQRAEQADLIIVGSNANVRHHLLQSVANPRKVFVDGGDSASLAVPPSIRFKAVFKRELCREDRVAQADFIRPLPFAAERRYFVPPQPRDILVSFIANMGTNPLRNSIHQRLQNRKNLAIVSGSTNERTYSVSAPQPLPISTPSYYQVLARSLISVSVPGMGYDCARYWEIPAAGAMLLTYEPDIVIPNGFRDGVDCATFASLDEFESKLKFYTAKPERAVKVAEKGHQRLLAHHTTERRAAWFLDHAMALVERPDYCARFLHPEIRALEKVCVGRGIEVSGGGTRTTPNCIGVDPAGSAVGAEITANGDDLKDFPDGSLDFVVARHDLERHADPAKALAEWKRVVRAGGRIGVAVHDRAVDPAQRNQFTMNSFTTLANTVGGLMIDEIGPCMPNWSFMAVLTKTG